MSSYPFLEISRRYSVSYGTTLALADAIRKRRLQRRGDVMGAELDVWETRALNETMREGSEAFLAEVRAAVAEMMRQKDACP